MATDSEQAALSSLKPYLIRAHHEWIVDNGLTPHLVVDAEGPDVLVPQEHVKDGAIILNIAPQAVQSLLLGNDAVEFNARFGGVGRRLYIPMKAIRALVAREYGVGVSFPSDEESVSDESGDLDGDVRPGESLGPRATEDGDQPPPESPDPGPRPGGRPSLRVVK